MDQLGVNLACYTYSQIIEKEFGRIEVCLGRSKTYEAYYQEIMATIQAANERKIPLSVHLPVVFTEAFSYDYLDAFYLDANPSMRQVSFDLLEKNLQWASQFDLDYVVIHFSGRYEEREPIAIFQKRLKESLTKINHLAEVYHIKILLEYFGVNINFYLPEQWIKAIRSYKGLGLLIDTGHFYFASVIRSFDFMDQLKTVLPFADAFHLWTTFGTGAYHTCQAYQKYHHIVPNLNQKSFDGWIYNTKEVVDCLIETGKPMIIEASSLYEDIHYYEDSIFSLKAYINQRKYKIIND